MVKENLSFSVVSQVVRYDPETGQFYWLIRPASLFQDAKTMKRWNTRYAGKETFLQNYRGYRKARIFNKNYWAHRVAWVLRYGEWPVGHIDHIDGNPSNNRIENLRDVSPVVNMRNQKKRSDNRSGITGVFWDHKREKWRAEIQVEDSKSLFLGYHDTIQAASQSREKAKKENGYADRHGL